MKHTITIITDDNGLVLECTFDGSEVDCDAMNTVEEISAMGERAVRLDAIKLAKSERAFDRAQNRAADEDYRRNA